MKSLVSHIPSLMVFLTWSRKMQEWSIRAKRLKTPLNLEFIKQIFHCHFLPQCFSPCLQWLFLCLWYPCLDCFTRQPWMKTSLKAVRVQAACVFTACCCQLQFLFMCSFTCGSGWESSCLDTIKTVKVVQKALIVEIVNKLVNLLVNKQWTFIFKNTE